MPWEKSFDMDDAIDRATSVFWAKGYEATSLSDLLEATGINKGSFYNAFGSKHELFVRGLLKYDREQHRATIRQLTALEDPLLAINTLFDALIDQCQSDHDLRGCLLVNTALDLPNQDEEVAKIIKSGMAEMEAFFKRQVDLGKQTGAIPGTTDSDVAAKGLLALLVGLRVLARGVFGPEELKSIKAQAIDLIS